METIPDNSLIAVLSTSALLLPASTVDASIPASPMLVADNVAGSTIDGISSQESASDIFVAFEQIRSSFSARSSWRSPGEGTGEFGPREDGSQRSPGAEGTQYDHYGYVRHPSKTVNESEGLLLTVLPSHVTTDGGSSRQAQGDRGASSVEEEGENQDRHKGGEDTQQARLKAGTPPLNPAATRRPPGTTLSDAARVPLLVFDTETFLALGELDERFTFQGGVAEWMSRARLGSIDQGGAIGAEIDGSCCCGASPRRCRGSPGRAHPAMDDGVPTGAHCSDDTTVQHVHARKWGNRFVRSWPDGSMRPSRGSSAETEKMGVRRPGVDWRTNDDGQQGELGKQVFQAGDDADVDNISRRPRDIGDRRTGEETIVDQWTRLPPAKLEALVQADADLFFLPLLLLQNSSG